MVHVNCNRRGSGKTKAIIQKANENVLNARGDIVFIDDDSRAMLELDRKIRFIDSGEFDLKDYSDFYGFLCGILSEDYDIESIFIDGLLNIVNGDIKDAALLFSKLEKLSQKYNVEFHINISAEKNNIPDFIKKYVA
ncbi:MAG: hypothetical protein ACERKV_12880 [Clostridiaceae bacterium]